VGFGATLTSWSKKGAPRLRAPFFSSYSTNLEDHSIKKPILSFERMGAYGFQHNFGGPAAIDKTCGFAPYSFEQFAFIGYVIPAS